MTALGPGSRINDAVDNCRLSRCESIGESLGKALRIGYVMACAAESLDEFVIARGLHEDHRCRIYSSATVHVIAAVDTAVVEDDDDNRKRIAANGLDLHAAETECAIALDGNDRFAARHGRADGIAHTDTHHAPGSTVEALARLVHVDNVAANIERVGAFIDNINLWFVVENVADRAKCAREVHGAGVGIEAGRHPFNVVLFTLSNRFDPGGLGLDLSGLEHGQE